MSLPPVVAVDGPSGSGKGTLCRALASELGFHLLDSGALYRLTAIAAADAGVASDNVAGVAALAASLDVAFGVAEDGGEKILLAGAEVTRRVRAEETGAAASRIAGHLPVRQALVELQHSFRRQPGLVADGRDMGTVIFPDAPLKLFLTASAEERARRRHAQLQGMGLDANIRDLFREIEARDARDAGREHSPLAPADDAVVLDTTELGIDAVVARATALAKERLST